MTEIGLKCVYCGSECDRDQLVFYANEGVYRCFEDAYHFEFKRHLKDLELLSEAKKVLEPLANEYESHKQGLSVPTVYITVFSIDLRNVNEFLKKLEEQ